mgnify:CR=1 FL=1
MSIPRSELGITLGPDQTGVKPQEYPFPLDKVIADLRLGFRISGRSLLPETEERQLIGGMVQSVTKFGDDLFTLYARAEDLPIFFGGGTHPIQYEGGIRRRKQLQIGEGTGGLEAWIITQRLGQASLDFAVENDHGDAIDNGEFSRRYRASMFDKRLTEELMRRMQEDFEKETAGFKTVRVDFSWISEESPQYPLIAGFPT